MQSENQNTNIQEQQRLSFDEKPIGGGQKSNQMSEYPPDYNPNQMAIETKPEPLPLQKRVHSKVWKIRKQAFQQLLIQVSENWSAYQQYLKDTIKFITDATPICQQKALKVFLKYLQSMSQTLQDPKSIIKVLIQKCLVVQKGQTPNLSTEILFWMMDFHQQLLLNQLNEGMTNKNPKICASVLTFLEKLLNNYGAKKLKQLQEFGKNFTLLSSAVRPIAKQQTISLFKQMYKWMGEAALAFNMHPEVKEQVSKFAKTHIKQPMIIKRGLNQEQKKGKKPLTQSIEDEGGDEPQDVLTNYDSRWVDKVLQQPKWKDKKSLLDEFIKKTKAKNIINRDTSHYITLIKRLLTDNNINLLQCGFKVIKNLSKGLKRNFTHPCKVIQSLVFSKLRDTKAMIVDQAQQTLQIMMNCLTLDDLLQDIKEGLKDKAPNMRLQTLKFIQKMVKNKDKKMANAFKNLTTQIVQMNQDGSNQVREKVIDVLCNLKCAYGLNFFGDKLKKIQGKKLQTIQNYIDPNSNDSKIDEEIIQTQNNSQSITQNKKSKQNNNNNEQKYKINVSQSQQSAKNSVANEATNGNINKISTFSINSQFDSPSQNARLIAYQNLLQKTSQSIYADLIQGYKNKVPMARQSNPLILKIVLSCVKKSVHSTVGAQHLEVLMYHDWKKCKPLLIQFIQNNKLNLAALQYVKNAGILNQSHSQGKKTQNNQKYNEKQQNQFGNSNSSYNISQSFQPSNQSNPLKIFYSSIQSLIPKMSNPDPVIRLQAAQTALDILRPVPIGAPIQSTIEPSAAISQSVSQFFNVLKFRIQDSNQQISNSYIALITQMLAKGFLTKYRTPGRLIISMLLQKIGNARLTYIHNFIHQMVGNHSVLLWQFLCTQLSKQFLCSSVLNVIRMNTEQFFKNADQKAYILPLLTCISKDIQSQKCSQLLDQIIQINGEQALQKIVKESKIGGYHIENYLKKWNITINTPNIGNSQNNMEKGKSSLNTTGNSYSSNNIYSSKLERINSQIQNPWPLTPSPTHILKMINYMISLGEPFQTLASPTLMSQHEISAATNLSMRAELLQDYSDIIIKWVFWRVHMQFQPKSMQTIFNLIVKLVSAGFELQECEIIILLGALIGCLNVHKSVYIKQLIKVNTYLNQHPLYKQRAFRFWINSFNDPNAPVDQILNLIVASCPDMIPSQMVTLARYPTVVRNKQFNEYLRANYTQKLLTVYGFKLPDFNRLQNKIILSQSIHLQLLAISEVEAKYFVQLFQRSSSNQLVDKLIQQTQDIPNQFIMQTHIKIMHSIIAPYLHRQLSFINVYNYFKFVQKLIMSANCSPILLNLVRTLAFFLIDLDQIKLQNHTEMLKTINKLLLILLQISQPKHILQVLFILMKQQLKTNGNAKLTLLLPKCIGKVIKNPIFKSQSQRTTQNTECLAYICKQFIEIASNFNLSLEHPVMRTIKNLFNQMVIFFPHLASILETLLQHNMTHMTEKGITFFKQLVQDKIKENTHMHLPNLNSNIINTNTNLNDNLNSSYKSEPSKFNSSQNTYVQTKDMKNAVSIAKSVKPMPSELGSMKQMQKMDD